VLLLVLVLLVVMIVFASENSEEAWISVWSKRNKRIDQKRKENGNRIVLLLLFEKASVVD